MKIYFRNASGTNWRKECEISEEDSVLKLKERYSDIENIPIDRFHLISFANKKILKNMEETVKELNLSDHSEIAVLFHREKNNNNHNNDND